MRKFVFLLLLLVFAVSTLFAAPANKLIISYKQSDGTELYIQLNGDEAFKYYSTIDGVPIVRVGDGDYYYAVLSDEGNLVASHLVAHNSGARSFEEQSLIDANDFAGMRSEMQEISKSRAAVYASSRAASISPRGDVYVPVLLVEYSDVKFKFSKEIISDILNKENYEGYDNPIAKSIGSAKDYFIAQSGGAFKPHFVVTDIVTLPNTMAYYGANNSSGEDSRPGHMIADGLSAADANFNFSKFDNDGDGEVEFVYCIYAGYGENVTGNSANTIWPHQWTLSATVGRKTYDGVKLNTYACSNELAINEAFAQHYGGYYLLGIGTMLHEFSHCLGLPDFYDTKGTGKSTFGYWDLMDLGSYVAEGYVPVGYSAYERDFMGWKSLEVLNKKGRYSMASIDSNDGKGYKIVNNANSNEYYVLENRQPNGWDSYIFNAGMLITHVDYNKTNWDNNTVNSTKSRLRFALIPADNQYLTSSSTNSSQLKADYQGDVWPGTTGKTEFTDTSNPAATVYTGGYLGKPVTRIKHENGIISFSFMMDAVDTPAALSASEVTATSFRANWGAVEGAVEYVVELQEEGSSSVLRTATTATSYLFTELLSQTEYRYRVSASDGDESSDFSEYISVSTLSMVGDITGDGVINVADVTTIVECILNPSSNGLDIGDVDLTGDGDVNVADITMLVSLILGTAE